MQFVRQRNILKVILLINALFLQALTDVTISFIGQSVLADKGISLESGPGLRLKQKQVNRVNMSNIKSHISKSLIVGNHRVVPWAPIPLWYRQHFPSFNGLYI